MVAMPVDGALKSLAADAQLALGVDSVGDIARDDSRLRRRHQRRTLQAGIVAPVSRQLMHAR